MSSFEAYNLGELNYEELLNISGPELRDLICQHLVVKASVKDLAPQLFLDLCRKMGRLRKPRQQYTHPEFPDLFLVTNRRDNEGQKTGLFADGEIGWHSNGVCIPNLKEICVGLYCVEPADGSVTRWVNTRRAYQNLSESEKSEFENLVLQLKFRNNKFYKFDDSDFEMKVLKNLDVVEKPLVMSHPFTEKNGLYFPHHFVENFRDLSGLTCEKKSLLERLEKIVFKDEYIYDHLWSKGDIVFSDQLHSLHKRNDFSGDRLLYRTAFDYKYCN